MHVRLQGCAAAALVGVHLLLKPAAAILSAIVTLVRSQLPCGFWPSWAYLVHQETMLVMLLAVDNVCKSCDNCDFADFVRQTGRIE